MADKANGDGLLRCDFPEVGKMTHATVSMRLTVLRSKMKPLLICRNYSNGEKGMKS